MMEQQTTTTRLKAQIWGRSARHNESPERQGYIHFATPQSTPEPKLQARGQLLALVHGVGQADGKRLLSALFRAYYETGDQSPGDRSPIQALQQAAAHVSAPSFARPATMVLAVVHDDRLYLAQTGDGGAYLWRDGVLYRLTEAQTGSRPDFYRPVILQAGDRLLLCNADLQTLFSEQETLAQLAAGPGSDLLRAARRKAHAAAQRADISLLQATLPARPPAAAPNRSPIGPHTAERLARWQLATWAVLIVIAVLQFVALLALRWL